MKTEPVANRCPKCRGPLPENAPQGLCPKCLLAAAATPTEAGQPPSKDPPPPLQTVAAAFPQLEILEIIGQGGMGVVYKARQPKLERLVALKLLPQALGADPAFAERFNREARVLARLNHPNIVTVHDFGASGGFFYLLMEFVDGVNLRQAMRAGRFTPQQAMLLVPKICEALQFAHDEGILHRDIKPENILLDTRGRLKIADFGIARLLGEAGRQPALTASGLAVGTPHYMAPEQLEHPLDIDQRADIYSLGVVFYEMLTGELPIGRFAPPSAKTSVDRRVDDIVFHALEKEREKRFRSANEVKTSVEAVSASAGGSAGPDTAPAGYGERAKAQAEAETRSSCYFNTPQRMRDCFPSAAARVFTCKGELVLGPEELTFISPWCTSIRIPLKGIQDLSVGQFQMWTTPWVMSYARVNFLSISFHEDGKLQTAHLTPVPPQPRSAAEINLHVGRWFERVQEAAKRCVGTTPHASDPEWLAVSAEPAWNRKGLPLTFAFAITSLAAWILMPQPSVPRSIGLSVFILSTFLLMLLLWFAVGFLRANHAVRHGNLDLVTSDDPPAAEPEGAHTSTAPRPRRRSRLPNASWLWVIAAGLLVPVGMLFWEASLFPSFGDKIFGRRGAAPSGRQCVIDTVSTDFGSASLLEAKRKLNELNTRWSDAHPEVQQQLELVKTLQSLSSGNPPDSGKWQFKCLVPPDHLARILFVRWTKGNPTIEPGFSAYFKTGHAAAVLDLYLHCEPSLQGQKSETGPPALVHTNQVLWNVGLGLGYTTGGLLPAPASYRLQDTAGRMTVQSGHQRIIRLMDLVPSNASGTPGFEVQLRILLEPLKSPAARTVPSEKEIDNYVAGAGLDLPEGEMLRLIKRLPIDP